MILLDIDGVLNPLFSFTLEEDGFIPITKGWATWSLNANKHTSMLENLDSIDSIEWCSSWGDDSNHINDYFALSRRYEYLPLRNSGDQTSETWKLSSVKRHVKNYQEKVVWIDDELYDDAFAWAEERGLDKTLLIKTDPTVGLTEEQYQRVVSFLKHY